MTYQKASELLKEKGQEQVLRFWDEIDEEGKEKLLSQISSLDFDAIERVHGEKEAPKGKISPLGALTIEEIEKGRAEYEKKGIEAIQSSKVGAVLLAGGQGTRLGSDKPKGMYNVGETRSLYIFECLINNLLDVVKQAGAYIPLYIMTSEKNNKDTVEFFEEKNYFGYDKSFVKFFVQDMAASVDYDGKILLESKDGISLSPNGNGGWFSSLVRSGLGEDIKKRGVEWLNVFAVDNVLQRICDPAFVGATIMSGSDCGGKVVKKAAPTEKVGVLCLEDNRPSIVEYYEMTQDMINLRDEKGELLYAYGVILNYLFKVEKLFSVPLSEMPVHIVEKKIPYITEDGALVSPSSPNGYKFETLVLDMIKLMDSCLSYEVVREKEFAPIKNKEGVDSVVSAKELLKKNGVRL